MAIVKTKTTYLEMREPPCRALPPAPPGTRIERLARPSVVAYRHLYRSVGSEWNWVDRILMPDDRLSSIIQDERVEIYVLYVHDAPAGFAELDRRIPDNVELAYFGLFPQFIGQGWGKYFLDWAVGRAWAYRPARVWVHTCDLDHPAALPNYVRAGFVVYDEKLVDQYLPDK